MRIVSLRAENVKRLRAVEIEPDGSLVVIGGRNEQGKSSVLDSIQMALGGEKAIPPRPIREGESKAVIVAKLDDLTVKRTFTPKGSYLSVENADGSKPKSPQAILDALVGRLSFDPLEFSRMDRAKQAEVLRKLVGLDFSQIDAKREAAYTERTLANRELKAAEARLKAAPSYEGVGAEVSVSELLAEVGKVQANNQRASELNRRAAEAAAALRKAEEVLAAAKSAAEASARAARDAKVIDDAPLKAQIAAAEDTNSKARANAARAKLAAEVKALGQKAEKLDKAVAACDSEKAAQIAAAKMPLPGLAVTGEGVTLKGLPWEQASSAEQLKASVAIGLALNPKLKVLLIRDGSLLDDGSMKALAEIAEKAKAQVWVERVGDKDASAVIIEDGAVLGAEPIAVEPADEAAPGPVSDWADV